MVFRSGLASTYAGVLCLVAVGLSSPVHAALLHAGVKKVPVAAFAGQPDRIVVYPSEVRLESRRSYRQFVVTGFFNGEPRDLTADAQFRTSNPQAAVFTGSRLTAAGNGQATITVVAGGKTAQGSVIVTNFEKPDPVRFKFETVAVLTKQGCATGSCHGSPHGKGGFCLSLFGYDPRIDRIALTRDGFDRRVNSMDPPESLMLKKPLLEIPHVGGKRLHRSDAGYKVLSEWIGEGANTDIPDTECSKIVLYPAASHVLHAPNLRQQISVLAYYSDGTIRDVSSIARYESSQAAVADVDPDGLITGKSRGQAAISVRYLDKLQSVNITVVEDIPGFSWKEAQENNFVDHLVDIKLQQLQYLSSGLCTDPVFLRRVYLDLTGLLPTAEKTREFLKDTSPGKRARLVDELLDSEEYARFWALKKADLMRVSPAKLKDGQADVFARWIVDQFRKNTPYDQFAREILTAQGDTHKDPPANYFVAIPTMEERTEMTAQLFMGTRLECAKCHNHPFENWTMRDYYSLGAVFARTEANNGEVTLASTGEVSHPTTGETMLPWGMTPAQKDTDADRRALFADWLTRTDNPFFARVEVNRIWASLMGRGIVDPVDDFRSSNPPSNGPLLDALETEFIKSGYDRKHMIRLICASRTYQATTAVNKFNDTDEVLFSHARSRMLTAEQLQDAISLTTRVLQAPEADNDHRAALTKQLKDKMTTLEAGYAAWLAVSSQKAAALPFWQGGWYTAGPFKMARRNSAPPPALGEQPIDPATRLPAGAHWQPRPEFEDGAPALLSTDRGVAHYLFRRIYSAEPRTVTADLKFNDTLTAWLNGENLTARPMRTEGKLTLPLRKGENDLVVELINTRTRGAMTYQLTPPAGQDNEFKQEIKPAEMDLLSIPQAEQTAEQKQILHDLYMNQDSGVQSLNTQLDQLQNRMDYATQRPYPQDSTFMATFGQPKRDTACTCERLNSPTLLQALELLNGKTAYEKAQAGAAVYAKLDDDHLIQELYLSGLCRYPTDKERATARQYIARAANRQDAVMDLVWTVINTQEFLFQH